MSTSLARHNYNMGAKDTSPSLPSSPHAEANDVEPRLFLSVQQLLCSFMHSSALGTFQVDQNGRQKAMQLIMVESNDSNQTRILI